MIRLHKVTRSLFISSLIGAVFLIIEFLTQFFGRFFNVISPCKEVLTDSAPCSLKYDGLFSLVLLISIGVLGLTGLATVAFRNYNERGHLH